MHASSCFHPFALYHRRHSERYSFFCSNLGGKTSPKQIRHLSFCVRSVRDGELSLSSFLNYSYRPWDEYALCLMKTWLSRIKETRFSVSPYGGKGSRIADSMIFATLLPCLHRCQEMTLHPPGLLVEGYDFLNLPSKSMKALELLTVNLLDATVPDRTAIWRHLYTQFQQAPRLCSVKLNYVPRINIRHIIMPWAQLVSRYHRTFLYRAHRCSPSMRQYGAIDMDDAV